MLALYSLNSISLLATPLLAAAPPQFSGYPPLENDFSNFDNFLKTAALNREWNDSKLVIDGITDRNVWIRSRATLLCEAVEDLCRNSAFHVADPPKKAELIANVHNVWGKYIMSPRELLWLGAKEFAPGLSLIALIIGVHIAVELHPVLFGLLIGGGCLITILSMTVTFPGALAKKKQQYHDSIVALSHSETWYRAIEFQKLKIHRNKKEVGR